MGGAEARHQRESGHPLAAQRRDAAFEQALDRAEHVVPTPPPLLEVVPDPVLTGRWVQRARRRHLGRAFLGLALLGVAAGLGLTVTQQTYPALAVLVGFTVVAVIAHTSLSVNVPTTVTLAGPQLTVHRGTLHDVFDLSGPIRRVMVSGRPNRPNWRVRFETTDGRVVELGPHQVDPHVLTAVLARYRKNHVPRQRRTES